MKKYLLGMVIGFLSFPLVLDAVDTVEWFYPELIPKSVAIKRYVPSYGLSDPFIQNCTKDQSKNGHGWVFINREYYKCGPIAIAISNAIYGEKTR